MIRLDGVSLSYDGRPILRGLTLHVRPGEHIALMGHSGCGKTSVLRMIAGLQAPDAGTVAAASERVSFVFQEPRLLPWLTAAQNVNAVLSDRRSTLPTARGWLERMGLSDAADKYPAELSGGMKQRVSLARALAGGGDILLLDEPFSGLDGARREELIALIAEYAVGKTVVLATHDLFEAEALADRVLVYENCTFA